ncbi:nitronate monooxygenase [Candidatus Oscillochloris fontis]|uniref:nitronate monooxygenase n=1 Tax=Candidatus Oscillochloris fontis TaxID=2496868 RepID=UPI00101C9D9E|nr:nitronate monooxygenase [Candidatus Oscillochloris fontis]
MIDHLRQVQLIQGGMGVYVSNWRLARAVAMAREEVTAGTVSGTALDIVYVRLLQLGDPGGHIRRGLAALDAQFGVTMGQRILERYFIEGGKAADARFAPAPIINVRTENGSTQIPATSGENTIIPLVIDPEIIELQIATGFVEVWLAKQGHQGTILINFLNKVELPLLYIMYGAMLAEVDGIVVGAGNPEGLPAICSRLAQHEPVSRELAVLYQGSGEHFSLPFDPRQVCGGALAQRPLKRPAFLAIVTRHDLAQALAASGTEPPDGMIIENHTAGGHNANPTGPLHRDEIGQPIYGPDDIADLAVLREIGLPFWLAGGYGNHDQLRAAQATGAVGIQAGSIFALCEESGLRPEYRTALMDALRAGMDDSQLVRTTLVSPTGFAFKVAQIAGTLSDEEVFAHRPRICDIGLLQQIGLSAPDGSGTRTIFQRCAAGPVAGYVSKRGLARNTEERRCLCNGLLACVGLGQVKPMAGGVFEEPAVVTLGDHLDGVRRLSRNGQMRYWAHDAVADILGDVV